MNDSRNVIDEFKGVPRDEIVQKLDTNGVELEIAIENLERDFNMGTIVRTANAFGVRTIHVIGSRQWNKRGAMMTDKYLHVRYYATVAEFLAGVSGAVIAIDNVAGAQKLNKMQLPRRSILVFGSESSGISRELLDASAAIVEIEQFGSTRSINVASAAAVAMYAWLSQHEL